MFDLIFFYASILSFYSNNWKLVNTVFLQEQLTSTQTMSPIKNHTHANPEEAGTDTLMMGTRVLSSTLTRASGLRSAMTVQITPGVSIPTTRMKISPDGEAEVAGGGTGMRLWMVAPSFKLLVRSTESSEGRGLWRDLARQTGEEILTIMWIRPTNSRMARLKSPENTARSRDLSARMKEDLA